MHLKCKRKKGTMMSSYYIWLPVLLLLICAVKMLYDSTTFKSGYMVNQSSGESLKTSTLRNLNSVVRDVIGQRNNLSKTLNVMQQKLAQMECKENKGKEVVTSQTGGWCEKPIRSYTDARLAKALADLWKGKYVGSFGDGPGEYKQLISDTGKIRGYDAYDGAPYCDVTSEGRVTFLDLSQPQFGLPLYDWVVSLEVAEHIPQQFERVYIDNIVRHAREGVVLSWAKPRQTGYGHVNNRPFEYIKNCMEKLGFVHDNERSQRLKSAAHFVWLKRNVNVYRRQKNVSVEEMTFFT